MRDGPKAGGGTVRLPWIQLTSHGEIYDLQQQ
jgi:hypothetical protein